MLNTQNKSPFSKNMDKGLICKSIAYNVKLSPCLTNVAHIQTLFNNSDSPVELRIDVPLPITEHFIEGFQCEIKDRDGISTVISGALQTTKNAQQKYDDAISSGHSCFCAESSTNNLFSIDLGNLQPYASATLTLNMVAKPKVFTDVSTDSVKHSIQLGDFGTDSSSVDFTNTMFDFSIAVDSKSFSIDPSKIRYRIDGFDYVAESNPSTQSIKVSKLSSFNLTIDIFMKTNVHFFQCTSRSLPDVPFVRNFFNMQFPLIASSSENGPQEVVVVMDTSGSMAGNALTNAKKAVQLLLASLPAKSYFNIIQFHDYFECCFEKSQPLTEENRDVATSFIQKLSASGGTHFMSVLTHLFAEGNVSKRFRNIIIMTDAEYSDDLDILFHLCRTHSNQCSIFTMSIGNFANLYLTNMISDYTNGKAWHIGSAYDKIPDAIIEMVELITARTIMIRTVTSPEKTVEIPPDHSSIIRNNQWVDIVAFDPPVASTTPGLYSFKIMYSTENSDFLETFDFNTDIEDTRNMTLLKWIAFKNIQKLQLMLDNLRLITDKPPQGVSETAWKSFHQVDPSKKKEDIIHSMLTVAKKYGISCNGLSWVGVKKNNDASNTSMKFLSTRIGKIQRETRNALSTLSPASTATGSLFGTRSQRAVKLCSTNSTLESSMFSLSRNADAPSTILFSAPFIKETAELTVTPSKHDWTWLLPVQNIDGSFSFSKYRTKNCTTFDQVLAKIPSMPSDQIITVIAIEYLRSQFLFDEKKWKIIVKHAELFLAKDPSTDYTDIRTICRKEWSC